MKRLPRHQPPSRKQRQPIVETENVALRLVPSQGHTATRPANPATHYIIPASTSSFPPQFRHAHAGGNPGEAWVEQSGQLSKTSERDKSEGARFSLLYLDGRGLR